MGLFHSIVSYFYKGQPSIPPEQIKLSAQELSHGLKLKMGKIQYKNYQLETQFIRMINKPKRDLFLERVIIDNMILGSLNYGVHNELHSCTQRIKNEADLISIDFSKVSDECLASIYSIVHLYNDLGLGDYISLKQFIPEPYPFISADKLQTNIRIFLEYKKPTNYQRNLYALEIIQRHQGELSLIKLNQVNHGFSNKPEIPQDQLPIDSANLYAESANHQVKPDYNEFAA